jgi:putative endonuclease
MHYVYILKLRNRDYYVGETTNLKSRIEGHLKSNTKTTTRVKPEEVVFYATFKSKIKALDFEKYLKSSSGFAFRNKRLI